MRQGNDIGTQYRSAIYTMDDGQQNIASHSRAAYESELEAAGHGEITTEIAPLEAFYYAEDYHQQYLAKNPAGYCGLGGTGVACPVARIRKKGRISWRPRKRNSPNPAGPVAGRPKKQFARCCSGPVMTRVGKA
jgi:hypothetical protein